MTRKFSLRWKFGLLVASVALVLAGLDMWLIPTRVVEWEETELRDRASVLADVIGGPMGVAIDLEQPAETLNEILSVALRDKLVNWAVAYNAQGKKIASVGDDRAPESRQALERWHVADAMMAASDVHARSRAALLGTVAVSLRSDRIAERKISSQKAMATQACMIVLMGIAFAWFTSNRMTRSIRRIAEAAHQVGRGDVSQNLNLEISNDELGDMANAFLAMNARLRHLQESAVRVAAGDLTGMIDGEGELFVGFRHMVDNLRQLATRIGKSSSAVASAAASMFSSVREQEASGTQQNSALEEIRRTVETLAASAEQVAADAATVREMAQKSLVSTQHTAEQTRLVSGHSDRIGEILALIQDIADKSDLLALNAALEGTKAGEVGRGFSLVAAEMRRLSEHVMDSVRDIRKLVADMHHASHASVLATEEGIKLARDTAAAAAKISEAVMRQREGTSQVKTAIVDIVTAVNDSISSSGDTTRSAESLLQLSHELKVAAKNFRVGAQESSDLADESAR